MWSNKLATMHSLTYVLYMNNSLYPVHHAMMMENENVFAPLNFGPELAESVTVADYINAYNPLATDILLFMFDK
jgi:hypothetical protein